MCVWGILWVCACKCWCLCWRRCCNSLELKLQRVRSCLTWVMETQLPSSARAPAFSFLTSLLWNLLPTILQAFRDSRWVRTRRGTYKRCHRESTGVSTQCLPERKGLSQRAEAENGRSWGVGRDCDMMCVCVYIHTYIHTYMHACIHTCMHTYIHIYLMHISNFRGPEFISQHLRKVAQNHL